MLTDVAGAAMDKDAKDYLYSMIFAIQRNIVNSEIAGVEQHRRRV
jgi:hypothetical protein